MMLPNSLPEWLWFSFFTVGSLGGWVLVGVLSAELWRKVRR
jgi:hypothetical protein